MLERDRIYIYFHAICWSTTNNRSRFVLNKSLFMLGESRAKEERKSKFMKIYIYILILCFIGISFNQFVERKVEALLKELVLLILFGSLLLKGCKKPDKISYFIVLTTIFLLVYFFS